MKLSIIIINYNTQELLKNCLNSISKNQPDFDFEIIVFDNASQDQSFEMVKKEFPQVRIFKSRKNLGFSRANNLASAKARGEISLFLNSDTLIVMGALREMVRFLDQNPKVGIIGPKILARNRRVQPYSAGYNLNLAGIFKVKLSQIFSRYYRRFPGLKKIASFWNLEYWDWSKPRQVDWVTGAALMIRKEVFKKVKGFDIKYFMYFEDHDLCLRVEKKGYQIFALPQAKVIHLGGQSFNQTLDQRRAYRRSQKYFLKKNFTKLEYQFFQYFGKLIDKRDERLSRQE